MVWESVLIGDLWKTNKEEFVLTNELIGGAKNESTYARKAREK